MWRRDPGASTLTLTLTLTLALTLVLALALALTLTLTLTQVFLPGLREIQTLLELLQARTRVRVKD